MEKMVIRIQYENYKMNNCQAFCFNQKDEATLINTDIPIKTVRYLEKIAAVNNWIFDSEKNGKDGSFVRIRTWYPTK